MRSLIRISAISIGLPNEQPISLSFGEPGSLSGVILEQDEASSLKVDTVDGSTGICLQRSSNW